MSDARVHSTKFDGSTHYRFAAALVHESRELLALHLRAGTRLDSYRGEVVTGHHHLLLYWLDDRHHDACLVWDDAWTPVRHYVNVMTPARWDGGTLRHVDLDLDVIRDAGAESVELADRDEFEEHRARWRYPAELVARCWATVERVEELMRRRAWPFDDRLYDWRPGDSVTVPG